MPLLSIQEMVDKTEKQRKDVKAALDAGYYDFGEANLFRSPEANLGKEDSANIAETLRAVPLREFMAKSGTTGIAGAAYLIPDKIHSTLFDAAVGPDICPSISIAMITDIPGSSLKVDIGVDGSNKAWVVSSGGKMPDEEIATTQATITPKLFGISLRIANDMIEDQNWDLMEWHIRNAGAEIGDKASYLALTDLVTGTDGDGTLNTVAADTANATAYVAITSCIRYVVADEWEPNTLIITPEAWWHAVCRSSYITYANEYSNWINRDLTITPYGSVDRKFLGLNTLFSVNSALHGGVTANLLTACKTVIFDKNKALLVGRKRWLRLERYSDPVRDLVGAVVTSRQDSVTVYNDAIATITNG